MWTLVIADDEKSSSKAVKLTELGLNNEQVGTKGTASRAPASAQTFPPDAKGRPFVAGVCRGPNGRIFGPEDRDYAYCMNGDGRFQEITGFSGKSAGVGIIITP